MTISQKKTIILSHPLFKDLNENEILLIAEKTREKNFTPKTIIITQDNEADAAYFIYHGLIRIYALTEHGEEINLGIRVPPTVIGEMALLDNQPRSACVEAIQETHALMLSKRDFETLILQHPRITLNLLVLLSQRLRIASKDAENYLSLDLKSRTWNVLQTLSQHFPDKNITLSQEELAFIVGATRARVTETLHKLQKQGLITLSHRKIRIV